MALGPGSKSSPAVQTTSPAPPAVAAVELVFSEAVVADMIRCAEKRPNVEDGGRLLGFQDFDDGRDVPTRLRIVALLPPGPRAQRSPTMLFQDGEWQDWAFSLLEGMAPDLLYLGSFHHHLSNGYDQFSAGDLEGYRAFLAAYPQRFNAFLGVLLHRPLPDGQSRVRVGGEEQTMAIEQFDPRMPPGDHYGACSPLRPSPATTVPSPWNATPKTAASAARSCEAA